MRMSYTGIRKVQLLSEKSGNSWKGPTFFVEKSPPYGGKIVYQNQNIPTEKSTT